jgi:hypothetical protein
LLGICCIDVVCRRRPQVQDQNQFRQETDNVVLKNNNIKHTDNKQQQQQQQQQYVVTRSPWLQNPSHCHSCLRPALTKALLFWLGG